MCDKDEYLLTLINTPYSGHRNYAQGRMSQIVEPRRVLEMVGGQRGYRRFVREGLKEGHREEYYHVEDQRFLGAEGFGEEIKRRVKEEEIPRPKNH